MPGRSLVVQNSEVVYTRPLEQIGATMVLWLDVIPYRMMRVEVATDDAGGSSRNLFRIKVDGLTDGIYWREVVVRDGNPLVSTEPGA